MQMVARGISEKDVKEGIQNGKKHTQYPDKIVSKYKYFSVVYKKREDDVKI